MNQDQFQCECCGLEYPKNSHYNLRTLENNTKMLICGYCNESYSDQELLDKKIQNFARISGFDPNQQDFAD